MIFISFEHVFVLLSYTSHDQKVMSKQSLFFTTWIQLCICALSDGSCLSRLNSFFVPLPFICQDLKNVLDFMSHPILRSSYIIGHHCLLFCRLRNGNSWVNAMGWCGVSHQSGGLDICLAQPEWKSEGLPVNEFIVVSAVAARFI